MTYDELVTNIRNYTEVNSNVFSVDFHFNVHWLLCAFWLFFFIHLMRF